ncbi:MAG: hypothetical protein WCO55_01025 [Candidatus Falkowbacteria bacterium]
MKDKKTKVAKRVNFSFHWLLAIVLLSLVIVFSVVWIHNARLAHYEKMQASYLPIIANMMQRQRNNQITTEDVDKIASWMTFSYVNTIFRLPNDYLKNSLQINDKRYPNLTISRWIRGNRLDAAQSVKQIKQTVANYLRSQKLIK